MQLMGRYLSKAYFAAAKTEEEREKWRAEYARRVQEYKEKGLTREQEPDGSYPCMLDGSY